MHNPPTTWEELKDLKEFLTDCSVSFLRFSKDQENYNHDMMSVSREEGIEKIKRKMNGREVCLLENIYPHTYLLQNFPNVEHFCLWSTRGPLSEKEISEEADRIFAGKEWMSMTRKNGFVSIPEIWHSHIYVKVRE